MALNRTYVPDTLFALAYLRDDGGNGTALVGHLRPENNWLGSAVWGFRLLVAASIILLNTFIGGAFIIQYLRRPARVRPPEIFVLNLLLGDTTAGVGTLINIAARTLNFSYVCCGLSVGLLYLGNIGSHVTLILVHYDRFVASARPLKYHTGISMTKTRCKILVGCGWLIPIAGLLGGYFTEGHDKVIKGCCNLFPGVDLFLKWIWLPSFAATTLCLVTIQARIYVHLRRPNAVMLQLQDAEMLRRQDAETPTNTPDQQRSRITSRIFFWLALPTCICLLMYFSIILWIRTMWTDDPCLESDHRFILVILQCVLEQLVELSILMNVLVYSYKTESIKTPVERLWNDIKKLLCFVRSSRSRLEPGDRQGATAALAESSV